MTPLRAFLQACRPFSTKPKQRFVQVCILGADTPAGQTTALFLKQNPTVSALHLQGTTRVEGICFDLNHMDTRCRVYAYHDMNSIVKSLKRADVVLIMGINTGTSKLSLSKRAMAEGPRVAKLAEECVKYAPKAVVVVAACPVSVALPVVAEVFRKTDWYHPGRLLGSAAVVQVKANSLAARFQNLDPKIIQVPIVGGPDVDCALPLFEHTVPVGVPRKQAERLLEEFREDVPCPNVSQALGLNRLVTGIALGLNGNENANAVAFVRSNIVKTCRHIVSTVKIGTQGVIHNYGLQKLLKHELRAFEESCLELKKREEMACDLVNRKDKCALPAFMIRELELESAIEKGIIR